MHSEYRQFEWDRNVEEDCRQLIRLAIREDLGRAHDWTTVALVDPKRQGAAALVTRADGIVAGLPVGELVLTEAGGSVSWQAKRNDGDRVSPGDELAVMSGPVREILTLERIVLNFIGRLCGIATLSGEFVECVAATSARIYDTRKTTPGWRRLEKYAVRQGGAFNHRVGLFEHVLIKDNHLAFLKEQREEAGEPIDNLPAAAIRAAREFLAQQERDATDDPVIVEIEVDTIEQLRQALSEHPQIVLLDNMPPATLKQAIAIRDELSPETELEASGGIRLETVAAIAATGVDRISAGALTHAATSLDIGLDWRE